MICLPYGFRPRSDNPFDGSRADLLQGAIERCRAPDRAGVTAFRVRGMPAGPIT
jgi:hypothetical protein